MEKLICSTLIQLFIEKPPDQAIRHIVKTGLTHLTKKDFMQLLGYLLGIVHPKGFEKLSKIKVLSHKSEEQSYRVNLCTVLSEISEMYPDAPPLPKIRPSHLIHPVGDNITTLLSTLSMIALIVRLQKNHGVEVEKYPSGDNIPKSSVDHFAQLAVESEEAANNGEQEKETLMKIFEDESRDLLIKTDSIKQETELLKEVLKNAISSLNLDESLKSQLADLNIQPPLAEIEAALENRFQEVETILNNLELCPQIVDNCRSLLEHYEFQQNSPVYLCGEQLRQKFHLTLKDDELSLENILEQAAEKLELHIKQLETFKVFCVENQVEAKLDDALSQLNDYHQQAATYREKIERLAEDLKNKYWEHMIPLLEKRQKTQVQPDPFYNLCKFVSELACLPLSSGLKQPTPSENVDSKSSTFKKDWFKRLDVPMAEPDYMFFFRKPSSGTAEQCSDINQPSASSSTGDLLERLPFSPIIKKRQYNDGPRGKERVKNLDSTPCSPAAAESGSESFPNVKFPLNLAKEVRKVLAPSDGDFHDVYCSTPPNASESDFSFITDVAKPWLSNESLSSED